MNQQWVRNLINVGTQQWYDREGEMAVSDFIDEGHSFSSDIPVMLQAGLPVLIYSGNKDFAANYIGGESQGLPH
jgi:hypothetical protein